MEAFIYWVLQSLLEVVTHKTHVPCTLSLCVSACAHLFSRVQFFATSWTVAHQAPLSVRFSRQEYWSGLSFPPPGDLPDPGIKPTSPASPALQMDSLSAEPFSQIHQES